MKRIRNRYMFILDVLLCLSAYLITIGTVFPIFIIGTYFAHGIVLIAFTTIVYGAISAAFGIYRIDWVYAGSNEYLRLITAVITAAVVSLLAVMLLRDISENEKLNYDVVGLIDDDPNKQKTRIYNSGVIGRKNELIFKLAKNINY